jgi:hypothetical protein
VVEGTGTGTGTEACRGEWTQVSSSGCFRGRGVVGGGACLAASASDSQYFIIHFLHEDICRHEDICLPLRQHAQT